MPFPVGVPGAPGVPRPGGPSPLDLTAVRVKKRRRGRKSAVVLLVLAAAGAGGWFGAQRFVAGGPSLPASYAPRGEGIRMRLPGDPHESVHHFKHGNFVEVEREAMATSLDRRSTTQVLISDFPATTSNSYLQLRMAADTSLLLPTHRLERSHATTFKGFNAAEATHGRTRELGFVVGHRLYIIRVGGDASLFSAVKAAITLTTR